MKKNLLILAASALACATLAVGLAACGDSVTYTYHAAVAPTCTTRGNEEYWSGSDGKYYADAKGKTALEGIPEIAALGHDYDEELTTPPTCTTLGTMTYTCKREGCGTVQTQIIEALGHDYQVTITNEATCTVDGLAVRTCSRGDTADETVTIQAGHVWNVDNTCDDCGQTLDYTKSGLNYDYIQVGDEYVGVSVSPRNLQTADVVLPYGHDGLPVLEINFANSATLASISLPSSLTAVTANNFAGCSALKSITVNGRNTDYFDLDGVVYLRGNASTDLIYAPLAIEGSVTIMQGVTSIPANAFEFRTALKTVNIPSSVTSFGTDAFYGCELEEVCIEDLALWCGNSFAGLYANPLSCGAAFTVGGQTVSSLSIPEGVKEISDYAFCGFQAASIAVPASVTRIGAYAFCENKALTTLTYSGDFEAWKEIRKGNRWNHSTPDTYTLVCTDGSYDRAGNPKS